jgi:CubicO group peptidase (beta-lactamase class C family)
MKSAQPFLPTTAPSEVGIPQVQIDLWLKRIQAVKIRSCLVIRRGHLVLESYKNQKVATQPQNIHSVTKSIVSALVGICLEQGLIPSLETPISEFFPAMAGKGIDPRSRSITVDHLLTMTPGYHWPEFGEWQAFTPMFYAPNWVRFVLERPMEYEPGERMNYNTGATHLLTAIVQRVTGMKAAAFAERHLFKPLGITEYRWHEDAQGINNGGSGMALTPMDMAKFGYLYLQLGRWGEKQLVPAEWVRSSTAPRYMTYEGIGHYGQHWWVDAIDPSRPLTPENRYHFALGFGGQYIIVVPAADLVVTMTSELFHDSLIPLRLFREHLLSACSC